MQRNSKSNIKDALGHMLQTASNALRTID